MQGFPPADETANIARMKNKERGWSWGQGAWCIASALLVFGVMAVAHPVHSDEPEDAAEQREKGDELAASGDLAGARAAYQRALELQPEDRLARNELGTVLFRKGHLDEAIEQFEKAVALDEEYVTAWFNLAFASARAERWETAVLAYRKHIELRPGQPDAWFGLARALDTWGKHAEAAEAYESYAEVESRSQRQDRVRQARARAEELRPESEVEEPEPEVVEAEPEVEEPEPEVAEAEPEVEEPEPEVAEAEPEVEEPEPEVAEAEPEVEEPETELLGDDLELAALVPEVDEMKSVTDMPETEPIEPEKRKVDEPAEDIDAAAALARGDQHLASQDFSEAADAFGRVIAVEPDNVEAAYKRAFSVTSLGRYSEAVAAWERVVEIAPDNEGARRNLDLARERMEEARRKDDSIEQRRQAREVYANGVGLIRDRRYNSAVEVLSKALDKDPTLIQAYIARGSAHMGLRNHDEARDDYLLALDLRADLAAPLFGLAEVYRALGDIEEAREYYLRYVASDARDVNEALQERAKEFVEEAE